MSLEDGSHIGMSNPNWWARQMAQPLKGDTTEWKLPLKERIGRALEGVLQKPGLNKGVTLFNALTELSG